MHIWQNMLEDDVTKPTRTKEYEQKHRGEVRAESAPYHISKSMQQMQGQTSRIATFLENRDGAG